MGTSRSTTESTLNRAKATLAAHETNLLGKGKTKADFGTDPKWRLLDGDVRQVAARLRKLDSIDATNAEVARAKAERENATEAAE